MNEQHTSFLSEYNGTNYFINSLKAQHASKGTLSEKQVTALQRFIDRGYGVKKNQNTQPRKEKATVATKQIEHVTATLFNLEPMEETGEQTQQGEQTPMLDNIEEMLSKIAGQVVESTMRKAETKLSQIMAKAEKVATSRVVMHVKVGDAQVKQLTLEAHPLLPKVIANAKLGENTLLVGPPGSGKTTLAGQLAEALGAPFGHLCFSAGVSETWLFGRQLPTGLVEAEFSKFYRNGGVFMLDELDAADANLLLAINTALANGEMYNPILGEKIKRHKDFVCIAGANTYGLGATAQLTGRNRLDAATLDRFVPLRVEYNKALEEKLNSHTAMVRKLQDARKKLEERGAPQVISTRAIARLGKLVDAGYTEAEAYQTLTLPWPKGLAKEIGLSECDPF